MGMWLLTGSPSFWAAHCSHRCFSIFLPLLISVRCTVAGLLQLSHFITGPPPGEVERPGLNCVTTATPPPASATNRISLTGQRQRDSGGGDCREFSRENVTAG